VPSLKDRERRSGALTLGVYILQLRTERGFTLRELEDKTGLSLSSLCRLEKGHYVPVIQKSIEAMDSLWRALGGDMNQMLQLSRRCPVCSGTGAIKGQGV